MEDSSSEVDSDGVLEVQMASSDDDDWDEDAVISLPDSDLDHLEDDVCHGADDQSDLQVDDGDSEGHDVGDEQFKRWKKTRLKSCDLCDFFALHRNTLSRHKESAHGIKWIRRKTYECLFCQFQSQERIKVQRHMEKSHGEVKFLCLDCDFNADDKDSLKDHVYDAHFDPGLNEVVYKCDQCSYKTVHANSAETHAVNVHGLEIMYCVKCAFRAQTRFDVKKHFYDEHVQIDLDKTVFKCEACGYYKTNLFPNFINHLKNMHNLYRCKDRKCEESFDSNALLEDHCELVHGLKKKLPAELKCKKCDYSAKNTKDHLKHLKSHTKRMFQCPKCGKNFTDRRGIKLHMKNGHKALIQFCKKCDFYSDESNELRNHEEKFHMKIAVTKEIGLIYKCEDCAFESLDGSEMRVHSLKKHAKSRFFCGKCIFSAENKASINEHKKNIHSVLATKDADVEVFKCDECDFVTLSKHGLKTHVRRQHKANDEDEEKVKATRTKKRPNILYNCDMCELSAASNHQLNRHFKVSHKVSRRVCRSCGFIAENEGELKDHAKVAHVDINGNKVSCKFCQAFVCKSSLTTHFKAVHGKILKTCTQCEFECKTQTELRDHINTKHKPEGDLKCTKCTFSTRHKSSLEGHYRGVHQCEVKVCGKCDYIAKFERDCKLHMFEVHMTGDHVCEICNLFRTRFPGNLQKHALTVHREDKGKRFKCLICGAKFVRRNALKEHCDAVHQIMVYQCRRCEFVSTDETQLTEHEDNVHLSGESPSSVTFHCHVCNFRSKSNSSVQCHIKRRHNLDMKLCSQCNFMCGDAEELMIHVQNVHKSDGCFQCPECPFRTKYEHNLRTHVNNIHNNNKKKRKKKDSLKVDVKHVKTECPK